MDSMQAQLLDFAGSNEQAGFRLQQVEVFNWGTFDGRVWHLKPQGENSLLTGDIGSGKSTLVDAITTLLVPAQRITYNKAAGAEAKERSLRSYVLGYFKAERGEAGLASKAIALRDFNSYSVILGHFYNAGYDQHVTLAQVFWFKDRQGQPERLYVVADGALGISEHFAGFGSDLANLRKRLRNMANVELHASFTGYGAAFRRRFGIDSHQAMELFNQTVSMKSVGNLTDFVRSHMLEAFPVETRIQALIIHFDDLNRAHEAVLKAKAQVASLAPLVEDLDKHAALAVRIHDLRRCREGLRPWFAQLKNALLDRRLENLDQEIERLEGKMQSLADQQREQHGRRDEIKRAIADNGGDRLERIRQEREQKRQQKQERQNRAEQYRNLSNALELPVAETSDIFLANRRRLDGERERLEGRQVELQNLTTEASVELHRLKQQHDDLQTELHSLRQRRSNLPAAMLTMRDQLCRALTLDAQELPFAGELIQVRDDERDWEGAAERVLHGFGLSLLVPDTHYGQVAEWVNATHLRGRLVYFRIKSTRPAASLTRHPQSLVRKLVIKPDSPCYGWLEQELGRRFDYACCDTLQAFRREQRAITQAGQIKASETRHEKDDRFAINDRSRFVLGWSNAAKIEALAQEAAGLEQRMQVLGQQLSGYQSEQKDLRARLTHLGQLAVYADFRELDWRPLALEMERLDAEYHELGARSDVLRTLEKQLQQLEQELLTLEKASAQCSKEHGAAEHKRELALTMREDCRVLLDATPEAARESVFPRLEAMRGQALGEHTLSVDSCDNREREMREWLQAAIEAEDKRLARLRDRIIDAMRSYQHRWPLETREVDVSVDAGDDYSAMLRSLQADDLPRFEARFKELLNENTIREVAGFQSQLNRERQTIRERIDTINQSLRGIDYNPGRYITLLAEVSTDAEVRQFQQQLRACTDDTVTGSGDAQYSEAKFLQVREIIERFRGREGTTELDRRWTAKATDVRHWFVFSASERWREDESEYEHYSDSGGKSGGQKEKLAYTVLAASLAYQFGLEWGETRSRSFRFVVIDEAFGRGSDESARYGLELFKRLNLQLLIVTPLQKIHIIEPFVASLGFVHNDGGRESKVRNIGIEDYQREKQAREQLKERDTQQATDMIKLE